MLPLFALERPLFPGSLQTLRVFEARYVALIRHCLREQTPFGVIALREGREVRTPGVEVSLWATGCLAHLTHVESLDNGTYVIQCLGGERFRLLGHQEDESGLEQGQVSYLKPDIATDIPPDLQSLANRLGALIASAQRQGLEHRLPISRPYRLGECGWVANQWGHILNLELAQKMQLLEEDDPLTRLTLAKLWLGGDPTLS